MPRTESPMGSHRRCRLNRCKPGSLIEVRPSTRSRTPTAKWAVDPEAAVMRPSNSTTLTRSCCHRSSRDSAGTSTTNASDACYNRLRRWKPTSACGSLWNWVVSSMSGIRIPATSARILDGSGSSSGTRCIRSMRGIGGGVIPCIRSTSGGTRSPTRIPRSSRRSRFISAASPTGAGSARTLAHGFDEAMRVHIGSIIGSSPW